jgi:methylthioribose-1-phosphate isomerase
MKIGDVPYRTIWLSRDGHSVEVIDQTCLPHIFEVVTLSGLDDAVQVICAMQVRGAPLIGATAAYGVALALAADPSDAALEHAITTLAATRPTAVNLAWALAEMRRVVEPLKPADRAAAAFAQAAAICDEDVAICEAIGRNGLPLIEEVAKKKPAGQPVNILTHCNAGWLATVDWGTALAPIYMAHDAGIQVHVWVDETRPRNQGAALTAWELGSHGVPHTVIVDNAGGHLMQQGQVDLCITGTDRVATNGDVANKIGTYLKALAASDNNIPFYVALPSPTIDWQISSGADIPIEERNGDEVTHVQGLGADGMVSSVQVTPVGTLGANPAFDVTPARLVTGLITERGIAAANREALTALYPECAARTTAD